MSHDQKEIEIKITDSKAKFGTKTKNIILRGYPSVIFCSANLNMDEQEMTRMILLSPETNQDKIREGIEMGALREADKSEFIHWLEADERRQQLKKRILAIKQEHIEEINIPDIYQAGNYWNIGGERSVSKMIVHPFCATQNFFCFLITQEKS